MLDASTAKKWCDVCFGIGGDGVIFALPAQNGSDFSMRLYNSDGSEPEMCGNGIRCLAKFVADIDGVTSASYKVHTLAGAWHNHSTWRHRVPAGSLACQRVALYALRCHITKRPHRLHTHIMHRTAWHTRAQ